MRLCVYLLNARGKILILGEMNERPMRSKMLLGICIHFWFAKIMRCGSLKIGTRSWQQGGCSRDVLDIPVRLADVLLSRGQGKASDVWRFPWSCLIMRTLGSWRCAFVDQQESSWWLSFWWLSFCGHLMLHVLDRLTEHRTFCERFGYVAW